MPIDETTICGTTWTAPLGVRHYRCLKILAVILSVLGMLSIAIGGLAFVWFLMRSISIGPVDISRFIASLWPLFGGIGLLAAGEGIRLFIDIASDLCEIKIKLKEKVAD